MTGKPISEFLEGYGLYRKYRNNSIKNIYELISPSAEKPPITRYCKTCKKEGRTFRCPSFVTAPILAEMPNMIVTATYTCIECEKENIRYYIYANLNEHYLMKIGQWPSWLPDVEKDKNLVKALGDNIDIYKKGLYCENEGCGIGAFAYYRRVVENIIDGLLDDLLETIKADETLGCDKKEDYHSCYKNAKESENATKKIKCAIGMVPDNLIESANTNPLDMLYSSLSVGVHAKPDDVCLESGADVRTALNHLIKGISEMKSKPKEAQEKKNYAKSLKNLEEIFK